MSFDDLEPRVQRGEALTVLGREDLDLSSVEALRERITALEAEIERSQRAIDAKQAKKSAADALFNFGSSE